MPEQRDPIVVDVWRGPVVESRHQVDRLRRRRRAATRSARYGDPTSSPTGAPSAKPFQARPWVDDGTVDHFGWGEREIAIMSASHVGADEHAELVRRMLADIGLGEDALRCDAELKARHNCSGNHTGFLAASVFHGWDVATYQRPDHPAQRAGVASIAEAAGMRSRGHPLRRRRVRHRRHGDAGDGCGARLRPARRRWRRGSPPRCVPTPSSSRARASSTPSSCRGSPGRSPRSAPRGSAASPCPAAAPLAVKVLDGADRAVGPALIALLVRQLGLADVPDVARRQSRPPVLNDAGSVVGELVATLP